MSLPCPSCGQTGTYKQRRGKRMVTFCTWCDRPYPLPHREHFHETARERKACIAQMARTRREIAEIVATEEAAYRSDRQLAELSLLMQQPPRRK